MEQIEKILKEYGVGWVKNNPEEKYKYFCEDIKQHLYREKIENYTEKDFHNAAQKTLAWLFLDGCEWLCIKDAESFSQKNPGMENFKKIPESILEDIRFSFVVPIKRMVFRIESMWIVGESIAKIKESGQFPIVAEQVKSKLSKEQQIKSLFDKELLERVIGDEVIELFGELRGEMGANQYGNRLKDSLLKEMSVWLKELALKQNQK